MLYLPNTVWGELTSLHPHTLLLWQGMQPPKGWQGFLSLTSLEKLNCKTEYDLWLSNADTLGPRYFSTPFEYYVLVTVQGLKSNTSIIIDRTKEPLVLRSGKRTGTVENLCGSCLNLEPLKQSQLIPTHLFPIYSANDCRIPIIAAVFQCKRASGLQSQFFIFELNHWPIIFNYSYPLVI